MVIVVSEKLQCSSHISRANFQQIIFQLFSTLDIYDNAPFEDTPSLHIPSPFCNVDVILLVHSCTDQDSFENIEEEWMPEIRLYQNFCPIVICCSKIDLRNDPDTQKQMRSEGKRFLTMEDAKELQEKFPEIAAVVENSALDQIGLKETFDTCVRVALTKHAPFQNIFPFVIGDLVHVYHKRKRYLAKIRKIAPTEIKVFFVDRPFWFNTHKVKKREDIEAVDSLDLLTRVFDTFEPYRIQIPCTVIEHIAEYLPERKYWSGRQHEA